MPILLGPLWCVAMGKEARGAFAAECGHWLRSNARATNAQALKTRNGSCAGRAHRKGISDPVGDSQELKSRRGKPVRTLSSLGLLLQSSRRFGWNSLSR